MNISRFFITRPIFAGVLSLLIFILGAISLFQLPISEYPEVAPPTVIVTATYPGANPKTIAETVRAVIKSGIHGDGPIFKEVHRLLSEEFPDVSEREMRKAYSILLEADGKPTGGKWNYDSENRKPPSDGMRPPRRISFRKDATTRDVLDLVRRSFPNGFGTLEPFHFAVTRTQALRELDHFIAEITFIDFHQ